MMGELRLQVSVRAKSVLKLDTGQSNLDYTYERGASIDGAAKNMVHAVVFNKGLTEARKFIDDFLSSYEDGWRDET
jgi:hypothetical protein